MLTDIKSESEHGLFEALADTLPALVRICDSAGSSIWFNREWLRFRGRTVEEEQGAGWLDGLHPDDRRTSLDILSDRFANREPYETKYRLLHHSGEHRWVLHRAAPRFSSNGDFLGFITACVDVHDATMAEHERTQFFNVASDILLTSNRIGSIDKVSRAFERVLGWTAEEMTEMPVSDLIHPDDFDSTMATSDLLERGEELTGFENRYRHKDGSYRWLSWRARKDAIAGKTYASAVDITERKLYEAELKATIDRHNLAISATSDGIWDWNVRTDSLYLSPRYIEMIGLTEGEPPPATGAEWRGYIHPQDIEDVTVAYEAFISGEASEYKVTFRMRHGDGSWRTMLSRAVALRDDKGIAYRMLGVHTDITEQREMESRLRALKDQAEAANRAKSDFLANMSHEIRTPMNAVIGATQLLAMGAPLTEKQQKLVGVLKDSAKALMDLLNDFLDLSKIEAGNLQFEQAPFDARHLVSEVLQMLDLQAQAKGLALTQLNECNCVNERMFIGDPARIRQVLLNLCSNAVKFTEAGGVSVEIACTPTANPDIEALDFRISDTGVGIPAEKFEAIFGKFEQGDSTVTRKFGGSGLGLAIVRALVDAMDGTITVESEVGKGSVFTVRLPLRRTPALPKPHPDVQTNRVAPGETPRVLIVEDLEANAFIVQNFLEAFGFRHDLATDGRLALDRIMAGEVYDAILMDVQMPVMDGREATRRIRAFERERGDRPHHIIAMTAHAMLDDRDKCLEAGADDYLQKPFDGDVFRQKLMQAVAARKKAGPYVPGEAANDVITVDKGTADKPA